MIKIQKMIHSLIFNICLLILITWVSSETLYGAPYSNYFLAAKNEVHILKILPQGEGSPLAITYKVPKKESIMEVDASNDPTSLLPQNRNKKDWLKVTSIYGINCHSPAQCFIKKSEVKKVKTADVPRFLQTLNEEIKKNTDAVQINCPNEEFQIFTKDFEEENHSWNPQWTNHLYSEIKKYGKPLWDSNLLKSNPIRDVQSYCPNFYNLSVEQKIQFWTHYFYWIAKFESGFDPENNNSHGDTGLLQISRNIPKLYKCDMNKNRISRELRDPLKNLSCGVKILTKLVSEDHVISISRENKESKNRNKRRQTTKNNYLGAARHWGSVRESQHMSQIQSELEELPFCK